MDPIPLIREQIKIAHEWFDATIPVCTTPKRKIGPRVGEHGPIQWSGQIWKPSPPLACRAIASSQIYAKWTMLV